MGEGDVKTGGREGKRGRDVDSRAAINSRTYALQILSGIHTAEIISAFTVSIHSFPHTSCI